MNATISYEISYSYAFDRAVRRADDGWFADLATLHAQCITGCGSRSAAGTQAGAGSFCDD